MNYEQLLDANKELATVSLKGKQYAQVNARVMAFRKLYPEGQIYTEILPQSEGSLIIIKTTVLDENSKVLSTGIASEREGSSPVNKTSHIENAETSSVGRALGFLGIGIDTSIASAEEVQNAIYQQETASMKITDVQYDALVDRLMNLEIPEEKMLKVYDLKSLKDMTVEQWVNCNNRLNATEDKLAKEKKK